MVWWSQSLQQWSAQSALGLAHLDYRFSRSLIGKDYSSSLLQADLAISQRSFFQRLMESLAAYYNLSTELSKTDDSKNGIMYLMRSGKFIETF